MGGKWELYFSSDVSHLIQQARTALEALPSSSFNPCEISLNLNACSIAMLEMYDSRPKI